jgi:hypothetical protein
MIMQVLGLGGDLRLSLTSDQVSSVIIHVRMNRPIRKGVFFEMILHLSVCRPSRIEQ